MTEKEVEASLQHEPFHPLKVVTIDGSTFSVPFAHTAVVMQDVLLIFIGVKSGKSRLAKTFEVIPFDRIDRISDGRRLPKRRRKAS